MKRIMLSVLLYSMLMTATSAWSYTLLSDSSVNVGFQDKLIASATLSNSGNAEEAWLETFFPNATLIKQNDLVGIDWDKVNHDDLWALSLVSIPEYFLVKTGNTGGNTHYLFENLEDLSWAVISLSDVNITGVTGIEAVDKISHVTEVDTPTTVPEPGTVLLLGTGILGLAVYGKRRRNG